MFGRKRVKPLDLDRLDQLPPLLAEGKPILIDFFQFGCRNCKIMDGIVNELAEEYGDSLRVVKVNVARVSGSAEAFSVRATPTFVLLARPTKALSKKKAKRSPAPAPERAGRAALTPRWRASGLVRKDQMARVLESNGAVRVAP